MSVAGHYTVGFVKGLFWRFRKRREIVQKIKKLDAWGWAREVAQHDSELTLHQEEEARAWGWGARKGSGVSVPEYIPPGRRT